MLSQGPVPFMAVHAARSVMQTCIPLTGLCRAQIQHLLQQPQHQMRQLWRQLSLQQPE